MHDLLLPLTKFDKTVLEKGGVVLVDKPLGWTSFDVVNKLRYAIRHVLGVKKYKVGHAGTLDPLATGLLVICLAKYTKKIEGFMGMDKAYEGTLKMWEETPSYDAELRPSIYHPRIYVSDERVFETARSFLGDQLQQPPMYSAVKKKGVPLYKLARKGIQIEVKKRLINIESFKISRIYWPFMDFEVTCSKGTYIRSLVSDFGKRLNNGSHLATLRRVRVGSFMVRDAWMLSDLISAVKNVR